MNIHRKGRSAAFGLGAAAAIAAGVALVPSATAAEGTIQLAGAPNAIAGSYIVVLKDGGLSTQATESQAGSLSGKHGGQIRHTYSSALRGYAASMSEKEAKRLAADPAVAYVQQDTTVKVSSDQLNPPSWGVDRIDQRDLPLNDKYSYATDAAKVNAYIIDTGIRVTHEDFGGRAKWGVNTTGDGQDVDCHSHGTHVAGTVGGKTYGVAKAVNLIAVKVLGCGGTGSNAGVIAGIDWVTKNAVKPAVANMSLGGGADQALDDAVKRSIAAGISYAVAAGNEGQDACGSSPARTPEAITVAATDKKDGRVSNDIWTSNYGKCVDIFAPGDNIVSASNDDDKGSKVKSGTSMATPHVAGAAALYLSLIPAASPQQVRDDLVKYATKGKITNGGDGSPNELLYTGSSDTPPPAGCKPVTNGNKVKIPDAGPPVTSTVTVSGCSGKASATAKLSGTIKHPFRGDLVIDLIAPSGKVYPIKGANWADGADDVTGDLPLDLSAESANGTWKLRIQDVYPVDTGYLETWTLTL